MEGPCLRCGAGYIKIALLTVLLTASLSTASTQHKQILREKRQIKFEPVDGWSKWGDLSTCSRTCGAGVAFQERSCLHKPEDGSPACVGPSRLYQSCNIQDCPEGTKDFRQVQCEQYNSVSFDGKYYEWVPYYGASNECELNCLAKGEKFYYRHAAKVQDGTRCNHDTNNVCVDGVCQEVGCDMMLGSKMKVDKCHECGGDGLSCKTHDGYLDTHTLKSGYNDLLLIPAGATSIVLEETSPSNSYLALRDMSGRFLVNGNWQIASPHTLKAGGSTFKYSRGAHPVDQAESLRAGGPTEDPLFLVVLKQPGNSPQVSFEYSLPASVQTGGSQTYNWVADGWAECSRSCGQGHQMRRVRCQRNDGQAVEERLCDALTRLATNRTCSQKPCPASWHTGFWETCSTSCGRGVQIRTVFCQEQQQEDLYTLRPNSHCKAPRPASVKSCNEGVPCPKWEAGAWSKCNRVCGLGQQTRAVYCHAEHPLPNTASDILPNSRCDFSKQPISAQECNEGPCDGLEWVMSRWAGCSGHCGHKVETRQVVCSSKVGEVFNDSMCDTSKRPDTVRACPPNTNCEGLTRWHATQWSQCSAACGAGVETRQVICVRLQNVTYVKVDGSLCDDNLRMTDTKNCTGHNCWGIWFAGPWGKCSARCSGGQMKREVLCFFGDQVATPLDCDATIKPATQEDCNLDPCERENEAENCKSSEFGCCPDGITAAEGADFHGCPPKDRIPTGLCVETEYGCCLDGITPAQGPFNAGCPYFTCKDITHGCCPDGQTPAGGPNGAGCPEVFGCEVTAYGCCPDNITPANGFEDEGCDAPTKTCHQSRHGCCPDGITEAAGPEHAGCDVESSGEVCEDTPHGCCPDGTTPVTGPNQQGCNELPTSCGVSLYGCCPDGTTAAEGRYSEGCPGVLVPGASAECAFTDYGCCPDGETAAQGPGGHGCAKLVPVRCEQTLYGCCDDGETIALSHNKDGCPASCRESDFGCCSDGITAASGPNHLGCETKILIGGCAGTQHGCCPDNTTSAHGPYFLGCNVTRYEPECDMTTYGCCQDGQTTATGHDFAGCGEEGPYEESCLDTAYGCCPDLSTAAEGPNNAGCPSILHSGAACGLPSETGPCRNFTVKWYFDPVVGSCTRFWYGGCDGNNNRFDTREECQASCVQPEGIVACYLPKSLGRCRASVTKYYYNPETRQCEQFTYGGCLGNDNRFGDMDACNEKCVTPQSPDICSQPHLTGPCRGHFERFFYDKLAGQCRMFIYGGCKGNDNRFETQSQCEQRCQQPPTKVCRLPMDPGPCRAELHKYFFDPSIGQCREFVYGGCRGNANKFSSMEECESTCHELIKKVVDICSLPQDSGPCFAYNQRWHYDSDDGFCKQFVYGGCDGNANRFETEAECRAQCGAKPPVDVCTLPQETGPCEAYLQRYSFDSTTGRCEQFVYGGCQGNANNFESREECDKQCPPSARPEDVCEQAKDSGPCYAYENRFYFDKEQDKCLPFTYGGCQGNNNNFESMEACETRCPSKTQPTAAPVSTSTAALTSTPQSSDVCSLPREVGSCYEWEARHFYNQTSGRCEHFFYGGCDGNGNSFATQGECEHHCAPKTTTQIPTYVATDVCRLAKDPGPCYAYTNRFYYDYQQNTCVEFVYGGCLGNHNNFDSKEDCEGYCATSSPTRGPTRTETCTQPKEVGPCYANMPRFYYDPSEGLCIEFVYGGCKGNDNNFLTMEDCTQRCGGRAPVTQAPTDPCEQPKDSGPCLAYITRYFYDSASGQCAQFIYGGCQGNRNRFISEELCRETCVARDTRTRSTAPPTTESTTPPTEPTEPVDICQLPKSPGECKAYIPSWFWDANLQRCQQFVWGGCKGNANRFETLVDCEERCKPATAQPPQPTEEVITGLAICGLRSEAGPCRGIIQRWYYDYEEGTCKEFKYGGCRGNENNFVSQAECRQACQPRDLCTLPKEIGPCRAAKRRYYFNRQESECQAFTYGGCQGNANRFLVADNCQRVCGRYGDQTEQLPGEETDVCTLPLDAGPCAAYQPNWYYDLDEDLCKQFVYGGCLGNGNRFPSEEECVLRCAPEGTRPPVQVTTPRRFVFTEVKEGDVCSLYKDPGPCTSYNPVWYFEPVSRTCRRFLYGGCDGNGNRFDSRGDCEQTCLFAPTPTQPSIVTTESTPEPTLEFDVCTLPSEAGPCRNNISAKWYYNDKAKKCQRFLYGGCEGNANRFETAKQCQKVCVLRRRREACLKPVDAGPCNDTVQRWYFDTDTKACRTFEYGGCEGNGNRFETEQECLRTCHSTPEPTPASTVPVARETTTVAKASSESSDPKDVCRMAMDRGPCKADIRRWYYDTHYQTCRDFLYGGCQGNANNFASKEKCHIYCRENLLEDICSLPREVGPCKAAKARWFFSRASGQCEAFTYGGCLGNENRFLSEGECRKQCGGVVIPTEITDRKLDSCEQPPHHGPCSADYLRYFYDKHMGECRPFIYGGCQSNDNNFESQEACYERCGDPKNDPRIRNPGDCYLSPDAGPCLAAEKRYHFDRSQGDCVAFYYGGCEGNGNNFLHYKDCLALCSKATVSCGVLTCDLQCPVGYTRAPDGCPECKCADPCEDHKCEEGFRCQVEQEECLPDDKSCPPPRAVCAPKPKDGACPVIDPNVIMACDHPCRNDVDCPEAEKCCSSSCGPQCMAPQAPEESPMIADDLDSQVTSTLGATVVLPCQATGSPLPQISWYKDGFPMNLDGEESRIVVKEDNSLELRALDSTDSATFTCRAYNGVGDSATKAYTITVQEPVRLGEMEPTVQVRFGEIARLECIAYGRPTPDIIWMRNGAEVAYDGLRVFIEGANTLVIEDVTMGDEGDYVCEASNGVGENQRATVHLNVLSPLSATLAPHNMTYTIGGDMRLLCLVSGEGDIKITWSRDDVAMVFSDRIKSTVVGELLIEDILPEDAGVYRCSATRNNESVHVETEVVVSGLTLPENCSDKPWLANCALIVQARLCRHPYFSDFCCQSCHEAGLLP